MSRYHRTHAPGAAIHITARVQGRQPFFTPELRDTIANFILEAALPCGHRVLALAIMPNHFHVVLKQAQMPLGWMMQRAMQRTALLVKRSRDVAGHVFGAPYWSASCTNVRYVRQAIVYTHLNPWKAGLCADMTDPGSYRWTTHNVCAGRPAGADWPAAAAAHETRMVFADDSLDDERVTQNYLRFVHYWMKRHKEGIPGDRYIFAPPTGDPPTACLGDAHWSANYCHVDHAVRPFCEQMDIRDRAIQVLRRLAPECPLELIRHAGQIRELSRIRRELIAPLLQFGYRSSAIARCLRVSPSVISDVAAELRRGCSPAMLL